VIYRLMTHENQHGFGVSLIQYADDGEEMLNGFVLNTFPSEPERSRYVDELAEITGYEVESIMGRDAS
jgi:hypothetical protein